MTFRVVLRHTENIDTQVGDRAPRLVRGVRKERRRSECKMYVRAIQGYDSWLEMKYRGARTNDQRYSL